MLSYSFRNSENISYKLGGVISELGGWWKLRDVIMNLGEKIPIPELHQELGDSLRKDLLQTWSISA